MFVLSHTKNSTTKKQCPCSQDKSALSDICSLVVKAPWWKEAYPGDPILQILFGETFVGNSLKINQADILPNHRLSVTDYFMCMFLISK